jgi:hypothetical protein
MTTQRGVGRSLTRWPGFPAADADLAIRAMSRETKRLIAHGIADGTTIASDAP